MNLARLLAILLVFYPASMVGHWNDGEALRYFDCNDDSDDCCDDYSGNRFQRSSWHNDWDDDKDDDGAHKYFYGDDDCQNNHRKRDRITVREPLHSFLKSLLETPLESDVFDINKVITNVEKKSRLNPSNIAARDISALFNQLRHSTDNAFEIILHTILDTINAEASTTTSQTLLGYLYNLKWSIYDLNDSISETSLVSSSNRHIEGAALNAAFALIDFLSSAMKLIENISTSSNAEILVGKILVEFFGILQLTFDVVDSCDVAINIVLDQHSRVATTIRSLILEVFSSLVNGVSDLSRIFIGDISDISIYFSQFNSKFSESISMYNSKYRDLLNSIENIFEIFQISVGTFDKQMEILMNQFDSITLDNAASVFKVILSIADGNFGLIDFALFILSSRVPQVLLFDANNIFTRVHTVESLMKVFLRTIYPPIAQTEIQYIEESSVRLADNYQNLMSLCYKFQIVASSHLSEFVSELTSMVILVLQIFTEFYTKLTISSNDLVKLYTGQTVPFLNALRNLPGFASLYAAAAKFIVLTPSLYSATVDTAPTLLENMSTATDNAFKLVLDTYLKQVEILPDAGVQLVNNGRDIIQMLNVDAMKLFSTTISFSKSQDNQITAEPIESDAQKLAVHIEQLTDALAKVSQYAESNIHTAIGTGLTGFCKELLSSVMEIAFYVVFNLRRYLGSLDPGTKTVSVLSSIGKTLINALSESSVPIGDFNEFLSKDPAAINKISGNVKTSIAETAGSLEQSLNGIVKPAEPPKQSFPTELSYKLSIVISDIRVNINNGNAADISEGLRNLATSTTSSFQSILNAVQQIIGMFPNEWAQYANVVSSTLPNVQTQTNAFIQDVLNQFGKSRNFPIEGVRSSAIRAISAVSEFGKAISDIVNGAENDLTYENVLLLVTLQKTLAINSQATSDVVTAISNILDVIDATKNNPLGDLAKILNNVTTSTDKFINGFTLSNDSNLNNVYSQIKTTVNTCNSQLSDNIATTTITVNY